MPNSTKSLCILRDDAKPDRAICEDVQRFSQRSAIYTLPKRRLENSDHIVAVVEGKFQNIQKYSEFKVIRIYSNSYDFIYWDMLLDKFG